MKIMLFCDEKYYQNLYNYYGIYDEKENIIGSDFDRNKHYIFHINNPEYINYAINNQDGFKNVTHVIIQKSLYRNKVLMKILYRFKYINPDAKIIIYFDDDIIYYEVLLSRIASNNLANIITNPEELDRLFDNDFQQDLSRFVLKKETKKLLKEFNMY